ncbi:MAG: lipopolysaccharide heptosyltransferase II [Geobacteraceae bacterium]|nr:lipopolysaccharide heptosyltransferase II [Geobacteraceae bacterium]NTW80074.1 lipopolysaccharide heptosyltransferase II [Geobacteraceae bacterium]
MSHDNAKKKILVLRYRFIGDTILTVPFLRNLRLAEPDAYIAWVVAPGTAAVVDGIPYVDELICWDPVTIHADSRGTHKTLGDKVKFIRDLRTRRFDKVYVLKRSFGSALIGYLSGARKRIGFATEGRSFLLTKSVPYRHDQHEVQNFLDVLRADGVPVIDDQLEYWTSKIEESQAEELLTSNGVGPGEKLVALHPFSSIIERGWHLDNFAELANRMTESGYRPLVLGAPNDRGLYDTAADKFGAKTVDLVGKSSLRITMALLKRCALFVGNDSGVMHLAAAADIPLVAIFGPQSPVKFGPWSRRATVIYSQFPCSPCRQKFFTECEPSLHGKPECIESITVAAVDAACKELLTKTAPKPEEI